MRIKLRKLSYPVGIYGGHTTGLAIDIRLDTKTITIALMGITRPHPELEN